MSVDPGSPVPVALVTEQAAAKLYDGGYFGQGVDVALIDSGITPVPGLDQTDTVLYGPDLSNEGGQKNLANLDTYGHGTHIAGIIAGDDGDQVAGVAPQSRIVSVKVAGATGETDIAQVIAGIDWVIEHKDDPGLNIRVLNLSLGVAGLKTNEGDPLSAAVERGVGCGDRRRCGGGQPWQRCTGNRQSGAVAIRPRRRRNRVVRVVGRARRRRLLEFGWQRIPHRRRRGTGSLDPELPSARLDAGSAVPEASVGDRYFRGSGTSQSAAVVSGFAALLLSVDPSLTPDQVKFLFAEYADDIASGTLLDGHGRIDLAESTGRLDSKRNAPEQRHPRAMPQAACLATDPVIVSTKELYERTLTRIGSCRRWTMRPPTVMRSCSAQPTPRSSKPPTTC